MKRTNVELDERLVAQGLKATGLPSIKALLNHALKELIRHESQLKLRKLRGRIYWKGDLQKTRAARQFG